MLSALTIAVLATLQNPAPLGPGSDVQPQPRGRLCSSVGASHGMSFLPGSTVENFFVTTGDPDLRRFIVTVPSTYDPTNGPYPVVFMFHGTGQSAGNIVSNTSWDEGAQLLDFIAVFPEALPYLLVDGTTKTKWHTDHVATNLVDPTELPLAADALFIRELFHTLDAHLNLDCSRVYASGFSNGGAFVKAKVRTQLHDIFAVTSAVGGGGVLPTYPGEFWPADGESFRPHFELLGTHDSNKVTDCVSAGDIPPGSTLPMAVATIQATPCMWDPLMNMVECLGLDPAVSSGVEDPMFTELVWSSRAVATGTIPRELRFRLLWNLTHEVPSGSNYPIDYVPILYAWMSQYTL